MPPDASSVSADGMVPRFLAVSRVQAETTDVATIELTVPAAQQARHRFSPGQFNMLYVYGVGEVPISISGDSSMADRLVHTVRAVGPVSRALTHVTVPQRIGVRGPYGNAWPLEEAAGHDVLVIAGGIGLMPLRPVLYHLLKNRDRYGRLVLLYGANRREDLLFRDELAAWQRTPGLETRVALAQADRSWTGDVGFVTHLLPKVSFDPDNSVAMLCGPEIMFRATAQALGDLGVDNDRIHASFERNMKCGIGTCGHCQFGPLFLCRDGPVFSMDRVAHMMNVREL